jgi:pentatricopeptide repeat protein
MAIEAMTEMNSVTKASIAEANVSTFFGFLFDSASTELLLFAVAAIAYFALFMQRTPKNSTLTKKMKVVQEDCDETDVPSGTSSKRNSDLTEVCGDAEKAFQVAFEAGDYNSVLKCWNSIKKSVGMPKISLPHAVESMQRLKKDTPFILRELKAFLTKFPGEWDMSCVNDLLETLAKRMDSDLMEKVVEMLPSVDLQMDQCTYEIFLNMYFTTRSFPEVQTLVMHMKEKQVPFTARAAMAVIKTALKMGSFDEALLYLKELKSTWTNVSSVSTAPSHIVSQLVELACKEHKLGELLTELRGMSISKEVLNAMLSECVRQKDLILTQRVEKVAREEKVSFTDATYGLLIKAMAMDSIRVRELFEEAMEKGVEVSADFVSPVLAVCAQTSNFEMAEKLYQHMKPTQLSVLSTFIRFYAENDQHEKACDVYEQGLLRAQGGTQAPIQLDSRMERSLMNAAIKCGRSELAQKLLSSSPSDIAKHIAMIKNCAAQKNLAGAVSAFSSLEKSGVDMNSVIYNTVLDACVECRDLHAAEAWMEQTKQAGMADVVSFNTLIKAHLQNKNFDKARALMAELKSVGLQPNRVTFNELINCLGSQGSGEKQRKQMWDTVEEMTQADVKPNQVTISILLKSLNSYSREADITRTMDLIDTMEEPMDEVLLSSVVEACVRIGKLDLLENKLKLLESNSSVVISGSHTYGSLIKAYGHARNISGVWQCWKEMRSRHIKPTSITLGCMVEAIVGNGDPEGAFELIHEMQDDEQCCSALNSVIYCSALKGFARERKVDRAMAVYKEMSKRAIEVSLITFNTLIDACARSGRMEYLPKILEDMKTSNVKANVITYSTMLKGHCQNGDVKQGFAILQEVRKSAHLKADEIMYNSLMDGCAQDGLVNEGLQLLEQMQDEGVRPSNFTLSILVKLMNRARKLEQAFSIVEEVTKKWNFQPNVYVYTNLMQACVSNQQLKRGMSVLEQMINEKVAPESRSYSVLIRGAISRGLYSEAAGLLRGALGLPDALPFLKSATAVCWNLDNAVVNEALGSFADHGKAEEFALPLLSSIRQHAPKVRIDAATQRKIMSPSSSVNAGGANKGKGKGKGSWGRQ